MTIKELFDKLLMDKYLEDNYKSCKNYRDGYCWGNPDYYCLCDYEGCQPLCEECEEEEE